MGVGPKPSVERQAPANGVDAEVLPEAPGRGLGTSVFTTNVRARRLYERLGFVVDDEREGRYSMHRSASTQVKSQRERPLL
jgi:ribosomal protein S18 acetylase RimI-like enzyme